MLASFKEIVSKEKMSSPAALPNDEPNPQSSDHDACDAALPKEGLNPQSSDHDACDKALPDERLNGQSADLDVGHEALPKVAGPRSGGQQVMRNT